MQVARQCFLRHIMQRHVLLDAAGMHRIYQLCLLVALYQTAITP